MPDDTDTTGGSQDGSAAPPAGDKSEPAPPPSGGEVAPDNELGGIVWDKIGTYTVDRTDKDLKD